MKEFSLHKMRYIKEREQAENKALITALPERTRKILPPAFLCDTVNIISEVKQASPSRGNIKSVDVLEQAKIFSDNGAAAISVLTDKIFFSGSYPYLKRITDTVNKPVLCKEFIYFKEQVDLAFLCGADMLLIINKCLSHKELQFIYDYTVKKGLTPIVEIHEEQELPRVLDLQPSYVLVNMRKLETLEIDFQQGIRTLNAVPKTVHAISASGIQHSEKIREIQHQSGCNTFLVGTSLMEAEDPGRFLKELAHVC